MQSKAECKWLRMSPRKVRRVVNEIRGLTAGEAFTVLRFMPFTAAREVEKVLKSAVFNLMNNSKTSVSEKQAQELRIVEAYANQGPTLSRRRPRARGTAYPILKRSTHITVVLADL
jgi:large subunit ribosomal protein L22